VSVVLVFLLVVIGFSLWWLAQQRLTAKPWLEQGATTAFEGLERTSLPTPKLALALFLAVVGAMFALLASAFFMRMDLADWQSPPIPRVLWFNTVILLFASVALQAAVVAARHDDARTVRLGLAVAGALSLLFLGGQLVGWQELAAGGHALASNPASSFFYLLTGMHGLHLAGGLVALGRTIRNAWREPGRTPGELGVELCAMYWHFMFLVWLAVLALVVGWADAFISICRPLLT